MITLECIFLVWVPEGRDRCGNWADGGGLLCWIEAAAARETLRLERRGEVAARRKVEENSLMVMGVVVRRNVGSA